MEYNLNKRPAKENHTPFLKKGEINWTIFKESFSLCSFGVINQSQTAE